MQKNRKGILMNVEKIFRIKSVEEAVSETENAPTKLKRVLGKWDVALLGIGAVIGAGIFVVTGTAAAGSADYLGAGPAIVLSFLITGIACGFSALCYAELASMIPISGSAYTYAYTALGEIFAWVIGWDLILEYMVAAPAVAIGWSGYFNSFVKALFGDSFAIPPWLLNSFMSVNEAFMNPEKYVSRFADKFPDLAAGIRAISANPDISDKASAIAAAIASNPDYMDPAKSSGMLLKFGNLINVAVSAPHIGGFAFAINLPALAVIAGLTYILVVGVSQTSKFNNVIVALKFLILGVFIVVGIQHVDPANWIPFMPNGLRGVQTGAAIIFFAYIGFDALSTAAEETKNPGKDLPFGIIVSLAVCTGLYMIVSGIMTGLCPWDRLGTPEPIATALEYVGQNFIAHYIVSIGAVVSILAVLTVMLMAQPRILMSMSRDGFLPEWLSKIHPKWQTPYRSTIINGVIAALLSAVFSIDVFAELCNIGTLFAFVIVCLAIIVLRKKSPDTPRPFKTPFVPLVPILGILTCVYLMTGLPVVTWIRFIVWLVVGACVYFMYGYSHTKDFSAAVPTKEKADEK